MLTLIDAVSYLFPCCFLSVPSLADNGELELLLCTYKTSKDPNLCFKRVAVFPFGGVGDLI